MSATSDYLSRKIGDLGCEIAANRNKAKRLDMEHEQMAAELREVEAAYAAVDALDAEGSELAPVDGGDGTGRFDAEHIREVSRRIAEACTAPALGTITIPLTADTTKFELGMLRKAVHDALRWAEAKERSARRESPEGIERAYGQTARMLRRALDGPKSETGEEGA